MSVHHASAFHHMNNFSLVGTLWWALWSRLLGCAAVFEDGMRIGDSWGQKKPSKGIVVPSLSYRKTSNKPRPLMRPAMIFKFNRSKDAISNKTRIFSIRKRIRPASPIRSFTVYTYVKWFQDYTPKAQEIKCSSTFSNYLCLSVRWDVLHLVCYWPTLPSHFCKEDCYIEL